MSIAQEISRIQSDKSKIAIKLSSMGLAEQTANLTTLANAIDGIADRGAVNATVLEGETYTIPAGYHNGSGTVLGVNNDVADATRYSLQSKTVTPTKSQQSVTPDQGHYGLSAVTVNPIPAAYQDVTQVDAKAENVLAGKKIVAANGDIIVGEMPNRGGTQKVLDAEHPLWYILEGYHSGLGYVKIDPVPLEVTPSKEEQNFTPEAETVIGSVKVNPIPANYVDTSSGNATEAQILKGKKAWVDGSEVTGTMVDRGGLIRELNKENFVFYIPQGYHNGNGAVSINPDNYTDVSGVTATAANVLAGKKFVTADGTLTDGTMVNRGDVGGSLDGMTTTQYKLTVNGYVGDIEVALTDSIENALKEI